MDNQTDLAVDIAALEKIATSLSTREVELIITDNDSIAALNLEHRGKDKPTDVLSFPLESFFPHQGIETMPLGSIVISADLVKQKADEFGHSAEAELSLLFIHGLLHLMGFDHETDSGEMRKKEKATIEAFGLPSSLIVRTEEF